MLKTLDEMDIRILRELQDNARLSNVELADRVGLSPSPCLRRVKRLEAEGVIKNYMTLVDQAAVGLSLNVFVHITLKDQTQVSLDEFETSIRQLPHVMESYLMTGETDYLLRVVTADLATYEKYLRDHFTKIRTMASIRTSFAMKQVTFRTGLPLSQTEDEGKGAPQTPRRAREPTTS